MWRLFFLHYKNKNKKENLILSLLPKTLNPILSLLVMWLFCPLVIRQFKEADNIPEKKKNPNDCDSLCFDAPSPKPTNSLPLLLSLQPCSHLPFSIQTSLLLYNHSTPSTNQNLCKRCCIIIITRFQWQRHFLCRRKRFVEFTRSFWYHFSSTL